MKFIIPYRKWRYYNRNMELVVCREYKRTMKKISKLIITNFEHKIVENTNICDGTWYDKVTIETENG